MPFDLWLAFFAAAWAISFSPGPGAVFVMSASLRHGFARGYIATFGLVLGFLTQLAIVSVGLGALLATSALAFAVVKWAGVAYLVWLGVRQWRSPATSFARTAASARPPAARAGDRGERSGDAGAVDRSGDRSATPPVRRRTLVLQAWALNAVNPKGTAFMLAIVPQFLTPGLPLLPQYLVIAATLSFTDLVVNALYAALAARLLGVLRTPRRVRAVNRVFGGVFVALGVLLATFKRS